MFLSCEEWLEQSDILLDRVTFLLDELYALYIFDKKDDEAITKIQDDIDAYFLRRDTKE